MAQNEKYSLNEEITKAITKIDNIDPKRKEQLRNRHITVENRVIYDYDGRNRIDSGRKCGRCSGY